jgi:uncharacterized protein (DUF1778 family)
MVQSSAKTKMFNIRATEEQYRSIKEFAAFQGKNVSALFLDAVWERIEDFEDVRDAERIIDAKEETYGWDEIQETIDQL